MSECWFTSVLPAQLIMALMLVVNLAGLLSTSSWLPLFLYRTPSVVPVNSLPRTIASDM